MAPRISNDGPKAKGGLNQRLRGQVLVPKERKVKERFCPDEGISDIAIQILSNYLNQLYQWSVNLPIYTRARRDITRGRWSIRLCDIVAEKTPYPIEDLHKRITWPLNKNYGHGAEAFKLLRTNPDVWQEVSSANNVVAEELKSYKRKCLTPQPITARADVEVTYFRYEGIGRSMEQVATQAMKLKYQDKKEVTLSTRAVCTAIVLIFPPELSAHALHECDTAARKALCKERK
ncbi:hypothetical protein NA56DRAFT_653896 [Hyaloscypha hepaticicola]|uniref:Uncharacterized protein n=1 Tax=Hyaloscypha hepaticicola TaxID=2082293 RepID=A0A2J6QL59_9HELO|nr:hypothetical protein NA56DRAFT_653896 [Hyaloscypha hepaticicola]